MEFNCHHLLISQGLDLRLIDKIGLHTHHPPTPHHHPQANFRPVLGEAGGYYLVCRLLQANLLDDWRWEKI